MTAGSKFFSRMSAGTLWIALAGAVAVFIVLATPIHPPISDKTRRYAGRAQLEVFANAVEAYREETGEFPSAGEGLAVLAGGGCGKGRYRKILGAMPTGMISTARGSAFRS